MNLLALETSSHHLSVALWRDGVCLERGADVPNGGSERLLPWVNELLAEAQLGFSALDGIAFGAGPGGFTGLRLACGVTQGLAFGLDIPVVAVSTLEALAWGGQQQSGASQVFACLDARMNEVYYAAYSFSSTANELPLMHVPPQVTPPQLLEFTPAATESWFGCGDGFATYPDLLATQLAQRIATLWPTAKAVAHLGALRLARNEGVDASLARPLYVRDKVALTTAERLARGGRN